jgi:hypothetical protein
MAEEFVINSSAIETKINQLLPSQGGFAPGVDFSASTMVIPIVDLTESAEGSQLRQDLQSSLSLTSITSFDILNTTTTIINTTGYFRVFGAMSTVNTDNTDALNLRVTDGTTTKIILDGRLDTQYSAAGSPPLIQYDFIVLLQAGESLVGQSAHSKSAIRGCTRQLADLSGNLVNP